MKVFIGSLGSYLLLAVLFLPWRLCQGGKILLVPMEGSHWVNMNIFIKALHSQGHYITVVRSTRSWYIKESSPYYNTITIPVNEGFDPEFVNPILRNLITIERGEGSLLNFLNLQAEMFNAMFNNHRMVCKMATTMLGDTDLMTNLNKTKYDMVLTDPAWGAGIILAHYLKLPLVYNVRWITSGEGLLAIAPSPLSYVPMTYSGLSDKMTFIERVKNVFFYFLWQVQDMFLIRPQYQSVCNEFFGPGVDFTELLQGADLWLMRVDFVFEFPRPTMPNVVYMGGFQCKPSKPLPQELEDFVQSSGHHGVVIMSLGTMVGELPHDLADEIAAAFAQLPQKVIWKYKGDRPATLGNNTLLVDWIPQNDLLGHPKIKLFVAHGGTNGVQEAIYHGVPILGLPLFFDQHDNLRRLQERGAAKVLTMSRVDKNNNFFEALQELLHDSSYMMNMQRLSRLHRDTPMKPLDSAIFWIEFVMRHKGAAHLRTDSYKMPWYSYHSVDVVVTLLAVVTVGTSLLIASVQYLCVKKCLKGKVKIE